LSNVFLSHSHADKPFARRLANELKAAGHGVWIDEAEIDIGDSLIEKIRDGIDQVDYVAAILSRASIDSAWVTRELDIASNREIEEKRVVVLPLLVEDVELPGFLKGKFYGDFTDEAQFEEKLSLLLRKLGKTKKLESTTADDIAELKEALADAQNVDNFQRTNYYSKNVLILVLQNIAGKYTVDKLDEVLSYVEEAIVMESDNYNRNVFRDIVRECLEFKETAYTIVNKHWYALYE
jgi:hypothetical protein